MCHLITGVSAVMSMNHLRLKLFVNMNTRTGRQRGVRSCFNIFIFLPFQFICRPLFIFFLLFQFKRISKIRDKMILPPPPQTFLK